MAKSDKSEAKLIVPPFAQTAPAEPPKVETPKLLTADDIFAAPGVKVVPVDVPEWGGRVFVKQMTASDRDKFDTSIRGRDDELDLTDYRAKLVAATCCDEGGKLIFVGLPIPQVASLPAIPVGRVFAEARDLNGLGGAAVAEAKKN